MEIWNAGSNVPGVSPGTEIERELVALLKRDAVRTGEFTLSSGRKSHYYADVRQVTLSPEGAQAVGLAVFALARKVGATAVGGLAIGADPIVGATVFASIPYGTPMRGFIVRAAEKDHGVGGLVAGPLRKGDRVVIVDDVGTTGASALKAADAAEALGCEVALVVVVLDRMEGARQAVQARGYDFVCLATVRDLGIEPLQH